MLRCVRPSMMSLSDLRKKMSDHGMISSSMMKLISSCSVIGSRTAQAVDFSKVKERFPNKALPRRTTSQRAAQPMASPKAE